MSQLSIFDEGACVPCPAPFNLAGYVLAAGEQTPQKSALEVYSNVQDAPEVWSYDSLRCAVLGAATGLQARGVLQGDRVLLRIGNVPAFPVMFLASIAMGAVPVPTSAALSPPEVDAILAELSPALVLCAGGVAAPEAASCPILLDDEVAELQTHGPVDPVLGDPARLAYMIYTSGTSGKPRAVMHAHRAIWARRMMWDGWYGLRAEDRMLHAGAFNWTYTLGTGLMDPWAIGATAMVYTGAPVQGVWADLAARAKPSIFAAAPGVYRQILGGHVGNSFDSLRHGLSAGEKLPPAIIEAWHAATNKPVYEALGMSEVSTFVSCGPNTPPKAGAAGRVQTGRRVAVLGKNGPVAAGASGVLAVHKDDAGLMLGYFNQKEETVQKFQGDWFLTGDTVAMDADGYVTYLGRDDDMMNAGGYRVSPVEVELVLTQHPQVSEAGAAEVEVKAGVHVIAAFYVSKSPLSNEELHDFCAARLAKYKCPRIFVALDGLPKGANNKLMRKSLRQWKPET